MGMRLYIGMGMRIYFGYRYGMGMHEVLYIIWAWE